MHYVQHTGEKGLSSGSGDCVHNGIPDTVIWDNSHMLNRDRIYWIPNGYHTEEIDEILKEGKVTLPEDLEEYLDSHWCAVYTGSFVDSERLCDMLDAAKYVKENCSEDIRFAFIGNGYLNEEVHAQAERDHLTNVKIFPRIGKDQVAVALSKGKVCIAALRDDRVLNASWSEPE